MENSHLQSQFLLKPGIVYLNFGSFGACPKPIFEDYQKWQLELEREPVQFISVNGPENLQKSREALARYIHCNADDVVYTTNPSYAINIVAKNLKLHAGDEVLSTNLEYGSRRLTLAGNFAGAYLVPNFTLFSQNALKGWEFSASVYNASDSIHGDPASGDYLQDVILQDGRNFRVMITRHF